MGQHHGLAVVAYQATPGPVCTSLLRHANPDEWVSAAPAVEFCHISKMTHITASTQFSQWCA